MPAVIIPFPPLRKFPDCAGSGLTWSIQRRTRRRQVAAPCKTCKGTGTSRLSSIHHPPSTI